VAYIVDVMKGTIEPLPDRISLEKYILESSYITRYLSRVVKDKALVVYLVLFQLSWFETGKGEIVIPWARVGAFIRSEQGNIIDHSTTVKRRLSDLFEHKCISVNRQRGGANEISVHLPSELAACRKLMELEQSATAEVEDRDERDYFNDPIRRLAILARDRNACVYCTADLAPETFVLDHLLPVSRGGSNKKHNLVAACDLCNRRRGELEPVHFLRENYRQQLLTQEEFLRQKNYVESLLAK
jgi:HNH endonuclease